MLTFIRCKFSLGFHNDIGNNSNQRVNKLKDPGVLLGNQMTLVPISKSIIGKGSKFSGMF